MTGMDGNSTKDHLAAAVAAGQHGLITGEQARQAGLTRHQIQRRVATGRWERVHRGVFRVAGAPTSWQQTAAGACLGAPPGAAATHLTAAALACLGEPPPISPHVTVTPDRSSRLPGVVVHRAPLPPGDLTVIQGVPVHHRRPDPGRLRRHPRSSTAPAPGRRGPAPAPHPSRPAPSGVGRRPGRSGPGRRAEAAGRRRAVGGTDHAGQPRRGPSPPATPGVRPTRARAPDRGARCARHRGRPHRPGLAALPRGHRVRLGEVARTIAMGSRPAASAAARGAGLGDSARRASRPRTRRPGPWSARSTAPCETRRPASTSRASCS